MSQYLTQVITVIITDQSKDQYYGQKEGLTYHVKSDEDLNIGDTLTGFAYIDQGGQLSITSDLPKVRKDVYDWAEVVEIRRDLGVFVSIGLKDKDIVVSMDDLPEDRQLWPRKGDQVYITLTVDDKNRIWGKMAELSQYKLITHQGTKALHNNNIAGTIVDLKASGSYLLTQDRYLAYVPEEERETEPRLGQHVEGRVVGLREDGTLYASLKPRAHEVIGEDAQLIYASLLRSQTKSIPYHDKSDPEAIRNYFGISKGQFKRAVGHLMKQGIADQDGEKTYLVENNSQNR